MPRLATTTSLVGIFSATLLGCADERTAEAPRTPYAYTVTVYDETDDPYAAIDRADVQPVAGRDVITIEDKVARICNIPTPEFAFDSAKLKDRAEPSLDELAHCLTEGALKGEAIELVGHADPRGPEPYNLGLGQRRAGSVGEYLTEAGVEASNVTTTSRGELDAEGTGPEGWADDRRVEIKLRD